MIFTGATKNLFGVIPGLKNGFHAKFPTLSIFGGTLDWSLSLEGHRSSIVDHAHWGLGG